MGEAFTVNSVKTKENYIKFVENIFEEKKYITFNYVVGRTRTEQQNNAMYAFCAKIAEQCNDAGYWYIIKSEILKTLELSWTAGRVKKLMWDAVQVAMYPDTTSSTELTTTQMSKVATELERHVNKKAGIFVQFGKK